MKTQFDKDSVRTISFISAIIIFLMVILAAKKTPQACLGDELAK